MLVYAPLCSARLCCAVLLGYVMLWTAMLRITITISSRRVTVVVILIIKLILIIHLTKVPSRTTVTACPGTAVY